MAKTPRAALLPEARAADSCSRRIMLVTPSRLAYRSLFGTPGTRLFGAWTFYVALDQPFEIAQGSGAPQRALIALVPPHTSHRVVTTDRLMAQLLVEAETVADPELLQAMIATEARRQESRAHILAAFDRPLLDPAEFDLHFFGQALPRRALDPRVAQAIARIQVSQTSCVTAESCAAKAALSFSRFTHLFSAETGTTFRRLRAWKRARGLMPLVGGDPSLVNVALDAGYADSTHFSHSIRQFYGYTPRDIFAAVVTQWPADAVAA